MAFEKISDTDLVNKGVTGLPDVPGLSTSEMQAKFDELSKEVVIPKINDIIDGLNGEEVSKSSKVENPITKEKDIIQNVVNAIYNIVNQNSEARHGHANKNTLDAITEELYNSINTLVYMLRGITDITKTVTADDTKLPTSKAIVDYVLGLTLGYQVISNKTDLMSLNKSGYLVDALAVKNKFDEVDSKLGNFYLLYSHLCGTDGNSIWRQNPQFPEEYYAQYTVPEKEGYRFFFSFWQISWTNNNEYCNYLIRNPFLHEKNGNIEVYSKDGTPTFVPVFLCIYLPV